jgi:hypothetical protein
VIQSVLPLHECAAKSIANPIVVESIADLITIESIADPATAESIAEPLHSVAAPTETSCLCVQV